MRRRKHIGVCQKFWPPMLEQFAFSTRYTRLVWRWPVATLLIHIRIRSSKGGIAFRPPLNRRVGRDSWLRLCACPLSMKYEARMTNDE